MSDMKFTIGDTEYDAGEALAKVSLATLYELKVRTGYGAKSLAEAAKKVGVLVAEDPMLILEDKETFQAFRIIIWLARRHAGEKLSIDEATDFPLDEMMLSGKDEQAALDRLTQEAEAAAAGPKVDSVAGASAQAAAETPVTT